MKKLIKVIFCFCAFVYVIKAYPVPVNALSPVDIVAETAVLIDAETGQILFEKEKDKPMSPASVTKILTGLLAVELGDLNDVLVASETVPIFGTGINLQAGEEMTLNDALYALMLPSANDAGNLIAEYISGSQDEFAKLMNKRAREIGAVNSNFANAWGLDQSDHYITAYDMALITREAMNNEVFMEYLSAAQHIIPETNMSAARSMTNLHLMLVPDSWCYNPDVIGGKIGWWPPTNYTMATIAQRDGRTLICVVFNSGSDEKYSDTQRLLDYGFDQFKQIELARGVFQSFSVPLIDSGTEIGESTLSIGDSIPVLVPTGVDVEDLVLEYNVPASIEEDEAFAATVKITIPSSSEWSVPAYSYTLSAEYLYYETEVSDLEDAARLTQNALTADSYVIDPKAQGERKAGIEIYLFIPALVAIIFTAIAVACHRKRHKKL